MLNFYMENILKVGNKSKNKPLKVQKPYWKAGNQVYLLILVKFHAPKSRSAFPDPDLGQQINADPDQQHWYFD
jgi:hypothetical protein